MGLPYGLAPFLVRGGQTESDVGERLRLTIPAATRGYCDAQLDDYRSMPRRSFPWRPPLAFRVRARSSVREPLGTLGFGFWNDPFAMGIGEAGARRLLPSPPQTLWFFYASPQSDLRFSPAGPGNGWNAIALRSPSIPDPIFTMLGAGALGLLLLPALRRLPFQVFYRTSHVAMAPIPAGLDRWHEYGIDWEAGEARFLVDGETVLIAPHPPHGPLGLVLWIDNQFAVASPARGFRFGASPVGHAQSLELEGIRVDASTGGAPHRPITPTSRSSLPTNPRREEHPAVDR